MTDKKRDGDKLVTYLTMIGHICCDLCPGAISATMPFLVVAYGWSYATVGLLVFASSLTSAIVQPLFGMLGDRKARPWFMALGIAMAGAGVCCVGLVEDYWLIVAFVMLSGLGGAVFHPEGGRLANLSAGSSKAKGMSIFAVGGNIGFFLGPMIAAVFLSLFGLRGTMVFAVPTALCVVGLLLFNGRFQALDAANARYIVRETVESAEIKAARAAAGDEGDDARAASLPVVRDHWGKFSLVMGVLSLRSIVGSGLISFLPLFLLGPLGQSESVSSMAISAFAIAGAFATAVSGRASERFGVHRLTITCMTFSAALIVAFAFNSSIVVAIAIAMLLSMANNLFYPSSVALGMSYVPLHLGTASGLSYGFAISIGGLATPLLGVLGDESGLVAVMFVLAAVAVCGALFGALVAHADKR